MTALSYSGNLVRTSDNDRYLCSLFASAEQREGLFALYAFNSEVARIPEIVSDPMLGLIRLQWWREAIDSLYGSTPRQHEVITALHNLLAHRPLSHALFEKIITAREMDLDEAPPATLSALVSYAEDTSASLLQLALEVLDISDDTAREAAHHLGIAWALIGYIRAFRFHLASKRLLLPQELLDAEHLSVDDIFTGRFPERIIPVIRILATEAERHLALTYASKKSIPAHALPVFLHATMASHFLKQLKKSHYDILHHDLESRRTSLQLGLFISALTGRF